MLTTCPKCGNRKRELNAFCTSCKPTPGSIKAKAETESKKAKKAGINIRSLNRVYGEGAAKTVTLTKAPIEAKVKIKIITQAKDSKIKVEWKHSQCNKCTRQVSYHPTWTYIPKRCHFCRLRDINGATGAGISYLLTNFLLNEVKLQKKRRISGVEKQLLVNRKPLREKIQGILKLWGCNMDGLINACAEDNEVRKIIYMMFREIEKKRSSRGSSHILPKYILPFFQGGAPGLGKRS